MKGQQHDGYGKRVMREAVGAAFQEWGDPIEVSYGAGRPAHIDGAVGSSIAVEVESRVSKQVRGAVLDLVFHRYPKKLLVIVPKHMHSPSTTAAQCRGALARFVKAQDFRVVVLRGTGDEPRLSEDVPLVCAALSELGWPNDRERQTATSMG